MARAQLPMDALAELDLTARAQGLSPPADGCTSWLDRRAAEIAELAEPLRPAADAAVFREDPSISYTDAKAAVDSQGA